MRISDWSSDVCSSDLLFDPRFASLLNCWKGRSTAARRAMARRNGERLVAATIDLTATPTPQARPWWTHLYVQVLGAILAGVLLGHYAPDLAVKIGRASCRERVCQYV